MSLMGALALVPTVPAAQHRPQGEFKPFADCPLSLKAVEDCLYSVTNRGSITIGKRTVPIKSPVTLQGGFKGAGQEVEFYAPETGETLSETPQPIPGALSGATAPSWWPRSLQDWFNEEIKKGTTEVSATLELAAPAGAIELSTENLINATGTAVGLPVKIKLDSPLLGSNCYIGSNSKPVQIDFTTGKSGAAKGTVGNSRFNKKFTLITIDQGRLVNGTFQAPSVSGCGGIFSFFIDPLINSILGLPAESGENEAILEGRFQSAAAVAVRNSEPQ